MNKRPAWWLTVTMASVLLASGCTNGAQQPSMEVLANASSSPTKPLTATQADHEVARVRGGGPVRSWADLDDKFGGDSAYRKCVEDTLGLTWDEDISRLRQVEKERRGGGLRFVLASNVSAKSGETKAQFDRRMVAFAQANEDPSLPDNTPVLHVPYFVNTTDTTCKAVEDKRSVIRVSEAAVSNEPGDPIKFDRIMGVFDGCKNPWRLPEGVSVPTPSTSASPSSSPSTSPSPTETPSTPPAETKNPQEIPGNGGDGSGGEDKYGGDGQDRHTADPVPQPPAAGNPDDTYVSPKPPASSTPTRSAPPPEPSVNPDDGDANTGDPGGW